MDYITYEINGVEVECITIRELAKLCKRASSSLRKLEQRGILPPANFRGPSITIGDTEHPGQRIYTRELAEELAEIFATSIKQGVQVSPETKTKIIQLFAEERRKLS